MKTTLLTITLALASCAEMQHRRTMEYQESLTIEEVLRYALDEAEPPLFGPHGD